MRLIDADALGVGRCSREVLPAAYCAGWNGLVGLIEEAPTIKPADLVPKGRWENVSYWKAKDGRLRLYTAKRCSICGGDARKKAKHKFCPNCGADMRGGGDGTT